MHQNFIVCRSQFLQSFTSILALEKAWGVLIKYKRTVCKDLYIYFLLFSSINLLLDSIILVWCPFFQRCFFLLMRGSLFMTAWKSESSKYKILFASNKIENTILIIKDCPLKGQKNPNIYKGKLFYKSYYIKNLYLKKKIFKKVKRQAKEQKTFATKGLYLIHTSIYVFFSYKSIKKKDQEANRQEA